MENIMNYFSNFSADKVHIFRVTLNHSLNGKLNANVIVYGIQ